MRDVKIGAPGYILVDELRKDFKGTVRRVAELGFDGLEITGFFGRTAQEIRDAFEQNHIEPFGCFQLPALLLGEEMEEKGDWSSFLQILKMPGCDSPEKSIAYIKSIGCQYVGLCMTNEDPDDAMLRRLDQCSVLLRAEGIKLQYHNHNWEYFNMLNGERRMDRILKAISGDILFEPDLGWIAIGGYDPMRALRQYANRIEIVHLKDYYREGPDILNTERPYEFRPTGYGVMDWANIISYCERAIKPRWYVADHDKPCRRDVYEELGMSLAYIKHQLLYCQDVSAA